jgi:hypothetical protein
VLELAVQAAYSRGRPCVDALSATAAVASFVLLVKPQASPITGCTNCLRIEVGAVRRIALVSLLSFMT